MSTQTIQLLGTALLHFIWQGSALAVLLLITVALTHNPRVRYAMSVLTLLLMALSPIVTLIVLQHSTVPPAPPSPTLDIPEVQPAISNMSDALNSVAPISSFDLLTCFVWIWSGGVCLFGVRAFGGWLMLQKLRQTAQEALPSELLARCRRLQQRIGVKALVRYAYSETVDAPAVLGWFRPVVLIPLSAMSGLSAAQLEAIIAHELAHIHRYDALVNLFQIAIETVLFYHPAVWWMNRVIRAERENCCDDIAVSVCGNATEYARALATMSSARPGWVLAANGGALKSRVSRLLGVQKMTQGVPRAGLAALALMCASCIVVAAGVFKQDAPIPPVAPQSPAVVPVAPAEPPTPPVAPGLAALQRLSEIQSRAEQLYTQRRIHELEHSIAAMKARYTADYPPLNDALSEVAALKGRDQSEQTTPAPEAEVPEHSGSSYIDSLQAVGLTKLSVDEIITLKIQGVTADYIRQLKASGFEPSVREILEMKIQAVSPEYVRDIRATGLKPNMHEFVEMKIQGVTPEFIRAMQSAGFADLHIRDYLSAKIQGVTPEFIEKVRSHGFKDLTFRQLIDLKMADIF